MNAPTNPRFQRLEGRRFGRLTVSHYAGNRRTPRGAVLHYWACDCDCGTQTTVLNKTLLKGGAASCGCLRKEVAAKRGTTHGKTTSPEYRVYHGMKRRCLDPNDSHYGSYGGRGIAVCDWWLNSFEHFLADMGPRPSPAHSIERRDNDGNYEPNNCYWATKDVQARNRRSSLKLTYNGKRVTAREYCKLTGLSYGTFQYRLSILKWPLDRAIRLEDGRQSASKREVQSRRSGLG